MTNAMNFQIVPMSEVPLPENDVKVKGLEARAVSDGRTPSSSATIPESICFELSGLPPGQKAWIKQKNGKCQLVLEAHDGESEWLGEYASVQDALEFLSSKLS